MDKIEEIIQKFGYSGILEKKLRAIVPAITQYYGNEKLVIDTLMNVKIYLAKNYESIYDLSEKLKNNEIVYRELDKSAVSDSDMKRASGVFSNIPNITFDNEGNPKLDKYDSYIAVKYYDLDNEDERISDSTLIHEICHAIKSYNKPYEIDGDILKQRSGLIQTTYKIVREDEKIYLDLVEDNNVGIEEGINEYDTSNIYKMVTGEENKSGGYVFESEVAKGIMEHLNLKDNIRLAQFYPDKIDIQKEYNKVFKDSLDHWNIMNKKFDEVVKIGYDMFANAFNLEKWLDKNNLKMKTIQNDLITDLLQYKKLAIKKEEKSLEEI